MDAAFVIAPGQSVSVQPAAPRSVAAPQSALEFACKPWADSLLLFRRTKFSKHVENPPQGYNTVIEVDKLEGELQLRK